MLSLRGLWLACALLALFSSPLQAASPADIEEQTRIISTELRCVVCQNLSVADSPSEMAQQMRAVVREQVEAGKTPEEIKNFFVSKYGEWVLLKPKTSGFALLLWILPYVALVSGVLAALWFLRRWSLAKQARQVSAAPAPTSAAAGGQFLGEDFTPPDLEDSSARAGVLRERGRLKVELAELEFDFQSGKLSASDYAALKREIETKADAVRQQLQALPAQPSARKAGKEDRVEAGAKSNAAERGRFRRWQLITGGLFLLLFGLTLGIMLTQSLRPRASEGDTMTGDFLTGTSGSSSEINATLNEGKTAFAHQELPKAIEAFKKVLAADSDNVEAHSYMGFILFQAGHGDGALLAFDKALSVAPNFPMALWGKGMILYREKKDYAGARAIFERLLTLVPPGEERNEVAKVLGEIPADGGPKGEPAKQPAAASRSGSPSPGQISGRISVDPKLKANVDPNAALFIIARPAGAAGGPPLAVKKIDRPSFPLEYSMTQANVMMQGMPFTGPIDLTVRLDKDGNPVSRSPGDMSGDYKKNPVPIGTTNVDIVIDQILR